MLLGIGCRAMTLWHSSSSFIADLPNPAVKRRGALQAAAHFPVQAAAWPPSASPEFMLNEGHLMTPDLLSILPFSSVLRSSSWGDWCLLSLQVSPQTPRVHLHRRSKADLPTAPIHWMRWCSSLSWIFQIPPKCPERGRQGLDTPWPF